MFNAGVRGKRAKDGVGFLSTAEQFNQKSFLVPTVTSFSITDVSYVPLDNTAVDTAGGEIIVINGSGFAPGATVQVGATTIGSVTFIDQNRLAFAAPALSSGSYTIYVTNSNGGTGILLSGLVYSGLPTYSTSAGSLGTIYETANINTAVVATGDAPITYSVISGTLPSGATLNSNGTITGNAPVDGSSTTYSFTIQASDAQLQDSTRAFTLTISTDVLTWGLANNTVYSLDGDTTMSNVTLSATSSANSNSAVTFAANTLPTGVSLSGNTIFGTPTTEQTVYSTLTATATQTGRTATRFVSWVVSVSDLFFKYNTLAIQGADTTFVDDASTNNFAVTINGDTKPNSFNPYTPGYYSVQFNGSSTSIGTFTGPTIGTGDYTIEFWIYHSSVASDQDYYQTYSGSSLNILLEYDAAAQKVRHVLRNDSGTSNFDFNSGSGLVVNTWNHLAFVLSGSTAYTFINGNCTTLGATVSATGTRSGTYTNTLLGALFSGARFLNGNMSNFRFVKGTALYTSNFTPSTIPLTAVSGTALLLCQSNRFVDNSTNNYSLGTIASGLQIKSFQPFVPNTGYSGYGSTYFDGTGDYLSVPYNSALALGSVNTWTIEYWVYFNASLGTYTPISHQQDPTVRWCVEHNASTTLLLFDNSTGTTFTNPSTLAPNTWYHIAFVRDGTTVRMYINGAVSVTTTTSNLSNITSGPLSIGRNEFGGAYFFYMNGYIADVRLVKGTAVYTTTFTPPSAPLTAIANTSLLTLQNNQPVNNSVFLDNSTNNFLVTRNGNTTQGTFSPYGGNWSNYFNGTTDYLTVPGSSKLAPGNNPFTVECWFYATSTSGIKTIISVQGSWLFYLASGGYPSYAFSGLNVRSSGTAVTINSWNHLAFVREGTGSNQFKYYLNGTLIFTGTNSDNITSTSTVYIGEQDASSSNYWPGYLSNLRIINGTALYTSTFTPSTTPLVPITNTSLLTCQSPRFIDNSINNFTLTKAGDTSVQRFSPFNPSSVTPTSYSGYFDGTGDYLTWSGTTVGTGAMTFECWFYYTGSFSGISSFIGPGSAITGGLNCNLNNSTTFSFDRYGVSANNFTVPTIAANTWNHVAFVRNSSNVATVFFNGVRSSTGTVSDTYSYTTSAAIGYTGGAVPRNWIGYISNARLVVGSNVYDPTLTTITVPTTPLTAIANTSLLTLQSPTFIDNSTNNFTITAFGNSQPTQQNPFGFTSTTTNGYTPSTIGGSGYFDGTGDSLSIPAGTYLQFTGNYTIEFWIYFTSVSGDQDLVSNYVSNTSADWTIVLSTTFQYYPSSAASAVVGPTAIANRWYHFAAVRSGTTCSMYIDGVSVGTPLTFSGTLGDATRPAYIGSRGGSSNFTRGYMSDVRITKSALYTSNFVPPAQPLLAVQNTVSLLNMTGAGIYDAAMMNNLETVGDAKLSTAITKFGGSSMYFDGTGDYLILPAGQTGAFNTGNFTIEFWFYATTVAIANQAFIAQRTGDTVAVIGWSIRLGTSTFAADISNGSTNYTLTHQTAVSANSWNHGALVRSGTSITLYLNGVANSSPQTVASNYILNGSGSTIYIGYASSGSVISSFNGYIDDLRITKGYARYTSNFTPPTTTFKIK